MSIFFMFHSLLLDRLSWLKYGLSEVSDQSMRIFPADSPYAFVTAENRRRYLQRIGLSDECLILPQLTHSSHVSFVTSIDLGRILSKTDGVITNESNLILMMTVADCLPIYFVDTKLKTIGVVHAGWRGVVGEIVIRCLEVFHKKGSAMEDMIVVIGPHIQKQHFEIQQDIVDQFHSWPSRIVSKVGKLFVDLAGIVMDQLHASGLQDSQIEISAMSTFDSSHYFSARRDKPEMIETMMAWMVTLNSVLS